MGAEGDANGAAAALVGGAALLLMLMCALPFGGLRARTMRRPPRGWAELLSLWDA